MGKGNNEIAETEAERAAAEVAIKRFNDYETRQKPFLMKYLADVTGTEMRDDGTQTVTNKAEIDAYNASVPQEIYVKDGYGGGNYAPNPNYQPPEPILANNQNLQMKDLAPRENAIAGRTKADVAGKFNQEIPAGGMNRTAAALTSEALPKVAQAGAGAINATKTGVRNARIQGLQSAVQIGAGEVSDTVNGMNDLATSSANKAASDAESAWNSRTGMANAGMSAIGAAAAIGNRVYNQPATPAGNATAVYGSEPYRYTSPGMAAAPKQFQYK